jgi:predicted permease
VGAALLLLSFWRLHRVDLGFDGSQVLTGEIRLVGPKYWDKAFNARFHRELLERVRALPGVTEAGITSAVPFRGTDWMVRFSPVGQRKAYFANRRDVDPAFFSVMRIPLLRGRLLDERDVSGSERVVVISESLARQMFGNGDAIGKQLGFETPLTVVGVVKDLRYQAIDQAPAPAIYEPRAQNTTELICLVVRTQAGREQTAAAIRRIVREIEPGIPIMNFTTVDRIVAGSIADRRFYTATTTAFASLALLLTAGGLIVVVGRSVAERQRELAIRSALGAYSRNLVLMVIRQGLSPVLLGTALGLACAWSGARIIEAFLFEVTTHDPRIYLATGALTAAVALVACYLPARRASDLPPAAVLRNE